MIERTSSAIGLDAAVRVDGGARVQETAAPSLSVTRQLIYGAGEIPNAIKTVGFGLFTLFFYTTVMGLPGTLVGTASAIGLLWDAVIDPYIGYQSDKSRFRYGPRHTFMLAGALTMGVTFWAFFNPPAGLSTGQLFAWLLATSLLVRTATSLYGVPYFAFGAELSTDYQQRTAITAVRGAVALIGTLMVASLSFVVFFPNNESGADPKLIRESYSTMGLALGALMTLLGVVVTLQTRRWLPLRGESNAAGAQAPRNFFASFIQSFANPSFRLLFASSSLFFLAMVINTTLSIHYLTHYVKITDSSALSGFQFVFYVGALVGVGVWFRASQWMEKQRLYLMALVCVAAVMLAAVFLVGDGHWLGTGNLTAVVIGHALGGFFGSVLWFVPGSMIADVTDEDALVTGTRREGSFFGAFYFGQQVGAGVSLLLIGALLEGFAGLQPGQTDPSPLTVYRIGVLYGGVPAALVLGAGALILGYSLTRRRVLAIQRELGTAEGNRHAR